MDLENKVWDFDRIKTEFYKQNFFPTKIICDIVAFTDILNDPKSISCLHAISSSDLLETGYYADIDIDAHLLKIYVEKGALSKFEFV